MSNIEKNEQSPNDYNTLVASIGDIFEQSRKRTYEYAGNQLVLAYWQIGKYIVEFEQAGNERAEYGTKLLDRLSRDLTERFGKGFNRSNLVYIRQFYVVYPISATLSHQLGWSHYKELLKIEQPLERSFYEKQTQIERWSVRELKRQKESMLFHRLALSTDKDGVLALAREGKHPQRAEDIVRDPYILEFLKIPEEYRYTEQDIESRIIDNLQSFLLELGKGFAFIGRQYRITLANTHYYADLVFYHRILKCFVVFDIKRGAADHSDIGQMNMYLNYFAKEENVEDDKPPIGIILSAEKDNVMVEYALGGISNQMFVSRYQLYLPEKEQLEHRLLEILAMENNT
jgi:predicted nuclease of restriction endonuclease-like (RecB) superfamily